MSGLNNPVHLLLLLMLVAAWLGPALLVARLAQRKGRSYALFLTGGLVVGWLFDAVAGVMLASRPSRGNA